ncbi:hypothetical protein [Nostoc linckia]|nr:hypothetical protein [Nostoc linckia]
MCEWILESFLEEKRKVQALAIALLQSDAEGGLRLRSPFNSLT